MSRRFAKLGRDVPVRSPWLHSPRLHLVLYAMLLVATPFLLLRGFLQSAIGDLGRSSLPLAGVQIPLVPVIGLIALGVLLIRFRAYLTPLRIAAGVIAVLMNALAQRYIDYYFDHKFYDLQQNWHYGAYAIFAFMAYRDLAPRGVRPARIILITYVLAICFSTTDEAFQLHMSGRAFEVNDIAKDGWGALIGMVVLYLGGTEPATIREHCRHMLHRRLRDYFANPPSLLFALIVFNFFFLYFAALHTNLEYWHIILLLALGAFVVTAAAVHFCQYRPFRYGLLTILALGIAVQSYFYVVHRHDDILYNRYGLTVYKGMPIVYFDVLIFPDGSFRLVDKKHWFSAREQGFFLRFKPDILLIGSGSEGLGGRGFPEQSASQFIYNPYLQRGTQVIIEKTPDACELFNRLKREHKNVLFVLHNTC